MKKIFTLLFVSLLLISHTSESRKKHSKKASLDLNTEIDFGETFGKTHFIIGYPFEQIVKEQLEKKDAATCDATFGLVCEGKIKQVYFSPDDNIQKLLLHLIKQEKKSIKMTAYSFTDGEIAQALIDAHHRGINIELVVDPACILDRFGKVNDLKEFIVLYIYNPDYVKQKNRLITSIMHDKFIIFGMNILDKSLIWTGSFNFTKSAHQRNQENVLVLDDSNIIAKYNRQFEQLKSRSRAPKHKPSMLAKNKLDKRGTIFEDIHAIA